MRVDVAVYAGDVPMPVTSIARRVADEVAKYDFNLFPTRAFVKQKMGVGGGAWDGSIEIALSMDVPDSDDMTDPRLHRCVGPVVMPRIISLTMLEYASVPLSEIIRMEMERLVHHMLNHEVDEWLRYDGERIREPHPEARCRP